jgi:hypothetical protein
MACPPPFGRNPSATLRTGLSRDVFSLFPKEALKKGMEEKSIQFVKSGAEVYRKFECGTDVISALNQ